MPYTPCLGEGRYASLTVVEGLAAAGAISKQLYGRNATGHENAGVEALSTACNMGETGILVESGENHSELGRAYRQPGICPLAKADREVCFGPTPIDKAQLR